VEESVNESNAIIQVNFEKTREDTIKMSYETKERFSSIKITPFNGKKSEWSPWEEKYLARAKHKGLKSILQGEKTIPTASQVLTPGDDTDPKDNELIKTKELNESAYCDLVLSIDTSTSYGRVAFNIVKRSKTSEFPDGNAAVAWQGLKKKFSPTTAPTLAKLSKMFYSAKLRKGVDPEVFITFLEDLRYRLEGMKSMMTEEQFIIHVLNNLTSDYDNQVETLEKRIGSTTDPLTIEEIRDDLSLRYERIGRKKHEDSDEETDKALLAGQFKGRCRLCGKWGHKGTDCDSKTSPGPAYKVAAMTNKKFDGKCHYCNIPGHKKQDCRKKKKEDSEKATLATEDEDDIALMTFDHEDDEPDIAFMMFDHDEAPVYMPDRKFIQFLEAVAEKKNISALNIDSWTDAVARKLHQIEIKDVATLVKSFIDLNGKLRRVGHSMLHVQTLRVMAQEAGRYIEYLEGSVREATTMGNTTGEEDKNKKQKQKTENTSIYNEEDASPDMPPSNEFAMMATIFAPKDEDDSDFDDELPPLESRSIKSDSSSDDDDDDWYQDEDFDSCDYDDTVGEEDIGYLNTDNHNRPGPNTWIGDTGASCHLTNSDDGMYDVELIQSPIKIGNGKILSWPRRLERNASPRNRRTGPLKISSLKK
jgi:hypothetical protein